MRNDRLRQLEERVARLEHQLRQLGSRVGAKTVSEVPWWERTAGRFKDDPIFAEIVELGQKIREAERARARKGGGIATHDKRGRKAHRA